jgi:peptidoglycan/LPS O-acetylase OafA/YrhL
MRNRLDVTDLVAGLLVAGAITIYAAGVAGADLGGTRARASAVFLLGALACGVGARRDAFQGEGASSRAVAALNAAGVVTLIVGITAIVLGSEGYLAALIAGIGALFLGATARHLLTSPPAAAPHSAKPRELVKR